MTKHVNWLILGVLALAPALGLLPAPLSAQTDPVVEKIIELGDYKAGSWKYHQRLGIGAVCYIINQLWAGDRLRHDAVVFFGGAANGLHNPVDISVQPVQVYH